MRSSRRCSRERADHFWYGEQARDFTYIDNVVSANLLARAAPAEKVAGKVFMLPVAVNTIERDLPSAAELIGFERPPLYGPPRTGDILHSQADFPPLRKPSVIALVGVKGDLHRKVDWYRETLKLPVPQDNYQAGQFGRPAGSETVAVSG